MKHSLVVTGLLTLVLLGGCPDNVRPDPAVKAVITVSPDPSSIKPGDTLVFDASQSTSKNGGALTYAWNFAGKGTATTATATHIFDRPGLYTVTLTVADETGATGASTLDICVNGAAPTAVIAADVTSGPAALVVQFDGSGSSAPDDEIRDYIWSFGDGGSATVAKPLHVFTDPGTYTVRLTVRTFGCVEGEATATITVEASLTHSLQFGGSEVALLSLGSSQTLTDFTFEAWVKPADAGGTVVNTLDNRLVLEMLPNANKLRYTVGEASFEATAVGLANSWYHVALARQASGRTVLYLDGKQISSTPSAGQLVAEQLTLGGLGAFSGKIAEVRLWTELRSQLQITLNMHRRLPAPAAEANLLGYWRIDENGASQMLQNLGRTAIPGMLGTSPIVDARDPAWSTDGPELD